MDTDISKLYRMSPFYKVYKDNPASYIDSDMLFIEDIRELPHFEEEDRLKVNIFLFCDRGRIEVKMNGSTYNITEKQLLVCPSNLTLNDYMVSGDLQCRVFCITDRLLRSLLRNKMDIWNRAVYIDRINIVNFDTLEFKAAVDYYYSLIKFKTSHPEYPFSKEVITALMQAIVIDFCGFLVNKTEVQADDSLHSNAEKVFNRFMVLLARTRIKKQGVGYYASELCLTPKYLSKLCKEASGKSAHEWIEEAVQEDIKHCLRDPEMSLKEIVSELGFASNSFFGKYVKDSFGLTPKQLRKQLIAAAQ